METMIVRYNSIVTSVKKKGYDLLDHRKGEVSIGYIITKENDILALFTVPTSECSQLQLPSIWYVLF